MKKINTESDARSWTAHHEAAHAVACVVQGLRCEGARVSRREPAWGRCVGEEFVENHVVDPAALPAPEAVASGVVALLAGYYGSLLGGEPESVALMSSADDRAQAEALLPHARGRKIELLGRAGELVDLYQKAVRAVARELLAAGELSGPQIEKIVERNLP